MAASGPIISNMLLVGGSIDHFKDQKGLGISLIGGFHLMGGSHATGIDESSVYMGSFHHLQGSPRSVSYENERVKINIYAQNMLPGSRGDSLCSYVQKPDVIVVCVDMTDKNSLGLAKEYLTYFDSTKTPIIIAGTSCLSDKHELELNDLEALSRERQFPICLTDTKHNHGIDELLNTIANEHVKFYHPALHSKYTEKTEPKQESSKKNKMNLFSLFKSKDQKNNKLENKKTKKKKSKSQKMPDKNRDKPKAP